MPGHDVGGAAVGEVGQVDLVLNLVDLVLELGQVQHAAVSGPGPKFYVALLLILNRLEFNLIQIPDVAFTENCLFSFSHHWSSGKREIGADDLGDELTCLFLSSLISSH